MKILAVNCCAFHHLPENPRAYAERRGETGVEDLGSFLMLLVHRFLFKVVSKL